MWRGAIFRRCPYLDSPMASDITEVFSGCWRNPGLFKRQNELKINPFCSEENQLLQLIESPAASEKLIHSETPGIVIAGGGMCQNGRIRGHLRAGLGDENTTFCLVGYMAEDTLGRKLKDGWKTVTMNNQPIVVKARIVSLDSFSAHADSPFLNAYAKAVNPIDGVLIVHGEYSGALDLKMELVHTLKMKEENIIIPRRGEIFSL